VGLLVEVAAGGAPWPSEGRFLAGPPEDGDFASRFCGGILSDATAVSGIGNRASDAASGLAFHRDGQLSQHVRVQAHRHLVRSSVLIGSGDGSSSCPPSGPARQRLAEVVAGHRAEERGTAGLRAARSHGPGRLREPRPPRPGRGLRRFRRNSSVARAVNVSWTAARRSARAVASCLLRSSRFAGLGRQLGQRTHAARVATTARFLGSRKFRAYPRPRRPAVPDLQPFDFCIRITFMSRSVSWLRFSTLHS